MDGGLHNEKFDVESPMPKEVEKFREILKKFKNSFIESLEKHSTTEDIQDIKRFYSMLNRQQQFANILKLLLSHEDVSDQIADSKEVDIILRVFENEDFSFENLTNEVHDLCLYYIKNDIEMYPLDLNDHLSK